MKTTRLIFTIALPLSVFVLITMNVINRNISAFDQYIYSLVSKVISEQTTFLMVIITFFASGTFFTAVSIMLLPFFFMKSEKYSFNAAMIIINISLSSLVNLGFKLLISRSRPDILRLIEISGLSYPSGHSMASMSFYGFLIYLSYRSFKFQNKYIIVSIFSILIILIGFSRIYLGVHYASDVLGGFSLGLLWLGIFTWIVNEKYRKNLFNKM
ncbi:MAG: phosphatase family protein [Eubacterium sp.]|nr:phosphatase family protein [Eubacterium sp.]